MPTIQEQIAALRRAPEAESDTRLAAILDAIKTEETLLAAYHTPTKHYFMLREFGQNTAVLFTNRDSFERFAERCKEQGQFTAAIENPKKDRELLFADLWRCGFTRVLIDYAPEYIDLHLGDLFTPPDVNALPLVKRPVIDPAVTGELLYFMQQMHAGKADGALELRLLERIYHAAFLLPVERIQTGETAAIHVPVTEIGGQRAVKVFTDRRELAAHGLAQGLVLSAARYADLCGILHNGAQVILINPGSGAELALDAQLLAAAEKAVTGETAEFDLRSMQERGERITITDPQEIPDDLRRALTAELQNHKEVRTAYLRVMKKEAALRPSWLLVTERTEERGEKTFRRDIAAAVRPYLGAYDLECTSYEKAAGWVGNTKPFYQKRRFGFLKG